MNFCTSRSWNVYKSREENLEDPWIHSRETAIALAGLMHSLLYTVEQPHLGHLGPQCVHLMGTRNRNPLSSRSTQGFKEHAAAPASLTARQTGSGGSHKNGHFRFKLCGTEREERERVKETESDGEGSGRERERERERIEREERERERERLGEME